MDLNLLTALDALLSTGSVSGAAQRMHLSAPGMSHTLARIREALGDPILVRAGRKLIPTPRANALREPVRRLVAEASELMRPGSGVPLAMIEREFTVRAPEGMGIVYGAALLEAIREEVPLVRLRFVPESESDALALRDGRIDLDVGALVDRGLRYEPLCSTSSTSLASSKQTTRFSKQVSRQDGSHRSSMSPSPNAGESGNRSTFCLRR